MDKQSELHQCSATIFDIPSHLIASVCQFIIDGNYRSKNGAKSVSEDVENLAKTCRYFDTIVKNANLGIPHHIKCQNSVQEELELELLLNKTCWKIDRLELNCSRDSANYISTFVVKFGRFINLKLRKIQINIGPAQNDLGTHTFQPLESFVDCNTEVSVNWYNKHLDPFVIKWDINSLHFSLINFKNANLAQISKCRLLRIVNMQPWTNCSLETLSNYIPLHELKNLKTLQIKDKITKAKKLPEGYQPALSVRDLILKFATVLSFDNYFLVMGNACKLFPNLKTITLDGCVDSRITSDNLKIALPEVCTMISVDMKLLNLFLDCKQIRYLRARKGRQKLPDSHDEKFDHSFYQNLLRFQSTLEILKIEDALHIDLLYKILHHSKDTLKVLSVSKSYDYDQEIQLRRDYRLRIQSRQLKLLAFGHSELFAVSIDSALERKISEIDQTYNWNIRSNKENEINWVNFD